MERRNVKVVKDSLKASNMAQACIEYGLIDADLIAIMSEQNKKHSSLLLGPFAQQMVNHSPVPIISLRPQ